jgi:hypothetical protein
VDGFGAAHAVTSRVSAPREAFLVVLCALRRRFLATASRATVAGSRGSRRTFVRHVELFDIGGRSLDRPVLLSSRGGDRRSKPKISASEVADEHRSPRAQDRS